MNIKGAANFVPIYDGNNSTLNEEIYNIKYSFHLRYTDKPEIESLISSLKDSDAKDFYGLSNNILKKHKSFVSTIISNLLNDLLREGLFPDELKIGIVKPVFKSGDKTNIANYRPISIIPILSKIYECAILKRLQTFLDENNIIHESQFGFVKKSNTEAAVLNLSTNINANLENKLFTAALFIDFKKAFDSIDHLILIEKLKKIDLPKNVFSTLRSFMDNRMQCVSANNVTSSFRKVVSGVPQGSILGPTLFLIYINSINFLKNKGASQLYADDFASVYGEPDLLSLKSAMENDLSNLSTWLKDHRMEINLKKTGYILLHGNKHLENFTQRSLNITFNNSLIERKEKETYLGIVFDDDHSFKSQVRKVKSKINSMSYAISRMRYFVNHKTVNILYFAHIYSHLTYVNPVWTATNAQLLSSLFVSQKKALKIIYGKKRTFPTAELFTEKILPLPVINRFLLLSLAFKVHKKLIKVNKEILYVQDTQCRTSRQGGNFKIQRTVTKYGTLDFFTHGLKTFNELDPRLKNYHTIKVFQNHLREYLFEIWTSGELIV